MNTEATLNRPFYFQDDWQSANGAIPKHLFTTEPSSGSFGTERETHSPEFTIRPVESGRSPRKEAVA